jgi:hypothetical protein
MSDKLPDSDGHEDVSKRGRRKFFDKVKERLGKGSQLSASRSTSRQADRGKSPDRTISKAENAQVTAGAPTQSAAAPEATRDDQKDDRPRAKTTSQPGAKTTAAAGANTDVDMWAIAEAKLRQDAQKRKKLEQYDRILADYFGAELKPAGSRERREQLLGFLGAEIDKLNQPESETRLSRCSNKAKRFFQSAVRCVMASKDVITAAATPCLPAAVACAGVTVLLSVGPRPGPRGRQITKLSSSSVCKRPISGTSFLTAWMPSRAQFVVLPNTKRSS